MAEAQWAALVYEGGWFDPFREVLDAYFDAANQHITGIVRVGLYNGQIRVLARSSSHAIYDEARAVYRVGQDFGDHMVRGLRDQTAQVSRLALNRERIGQCDD